MYQIQFFFLNGQKYFTDSKITVLELLNYFDYKTSLLVLEYNNAVCSEKIWGKININNNDKIEIVTIVGGG
jgi:thiamine biosynthesis protein ThiS